MSRRFVTIGCALALAGCAMDVAGSGAELDDEPLPTVSFRSRVSAIRPGRVRNMAMGDLNGDGLQDLVLIQSDATSSQREVHVYLAQRADSFGWRSTLMTYQAGNDGFDDVAVDDVDGDGREDVVVLQGGSGDIAVLYGDGYGRAARRQDASTHHLAFSLATGDVDSDGRADVVTSFRVPGVGGVIGVFRSTAAGLNGPWPMEPTSSRVPAIDLEIADVDGDDVLDVVGRETYLAVSVFRGRGNAYFDPATRHAGANALGTLPLDAFGRGGIYTLLSGHLRLLVTDGPGTMFAPELVSEVEGSDIGGTAAGDIDGNGRMDIASCNFGEITIHFGRVDGRYAPAAIGAPCTEGWMASADWNRDGYADLVTVDDGGVVTYATRMR